MKIRAILLGTVACALLAAPALAQDTSTPPKHHHHADSLAARLDRMERLIEEQQAEIRQLKGERGMATGSGGATSGGATEATAPPAQPEVSAAQFEALQNQVYEQQAAAAALAKKSWWSNTQISGRSYFDITNISNKNDSTQSPINGTNFDLKRFYIGVDHQFDDMFAANLTTDVTYDSTTKASQIFIKKAYLQAKLDDAAIFRLGSADLPWVPFAEDTYGYRYVENTLIDRVKFGTSADWGVHLLGKFWDGLVNYQFSAINGAGYKKIPIGGGTNRSKGIDEEARVNLNYDGFVLGVGGYNGELGNDVQGGTHNYHTADRFDALAAYVADGFRVGVEYFYASNWTTITSTNTDNADGISGFASYQFTPEWAVFGRYDTVNPSNHLASKLHNDYFNVGVEFTPVKIVNLALVYKHDAVQDGQIADSNGTIGGTTNAYGHSGTYNEVGLFGQFRW